MEMAMPALPYSRRTQLTINTEIAMVVWPLSIFIFSLLKDILIERLD